MCIQSISSNLRFHSHLCVLTHFAGEASRWSSRSDHLNVFNRANVLFAKKCREYHDYHQREAQRYWWHNCRELFQQCGIAVTPTLDERIVEAIRYSNSRFGDQNVPDAKFADTLSRLSVLSDVQPHVEEIERRYVAKTTPPIYLYRPLSTVALGHTDNLTVVLTDEFNQAAWVFEDPDLPVRQTCIALCPDLQTLGEMPTLNGNLTPFVELHDIFATYNDAKSRDYADKCQLSDEVQEFPQFDAVAETPLLAASYYRETGLCNLSSGLLYQEALIRAMRQRIAETLNALWEMTTDAPPASSLTHNTVITRDDLRRLRCAFLCPIGWPDFSTLIFSTNYSLVASLLHAVRGLTFKYLFDTMKNVYGDKSDVLRAIVEHAGIHDLFLDISQKSETEKSAAHLLKQNHAFISTSTTLAIEQSAFDRQDYSRMHGFVAANPHFNVTPGHFDQLAEDTIVKLPPDQSLYLPNQDPVDDIKWLSMGLYDAADRSMFDARNMPYMELRCLLARLYTLRTMDTPQPSASRYMQDLFTEVLVPFSATISDDSGATGHIGLQPQLARLREALFIHPGSALNLTALKEALYDMCMPSPLSQTLQHLFVDFAKAISDQYLFENVLDLYALFAAVHRLFTREMKSRLDDDLLTTDIPARRAAIRQSYLDDQRIQEIAALVDLMANALRRRTEMGFQHARRWEEAVDIRGGMNKLVNAVDMPIECGMEILRRVLNGEVPDVYEKITEEPALLDARVGGASKTSYNTNTVTRRFRLGEDTVNYISDLSFDMTHLTQPTFLLAHLHETGHLLHDLIRKRPDYVRKGGCPCNISHCVELTPQTEISVHQLAQMERYEEIFADMFTYRLIHDPCLPRFSVAYMRSYVSMYYLDSISMPRDDAQLMLRRFAEVTIRAFLAIDPIDHADLYTFPPSANTPDQQQCENAFERYTTLLDAAGPMFLEYKRLFPADDANRTKRVNKFVRDTFTSVFTQSYTTVCCIRDQIDSVFSSVCAVANDKHDTSAMAGDPECLHSLIAESYQNLHPIVGALYQVGERPQGIDMPQNPHLDPLYVMRTLFALHIDHLFGDDAIDLSKETCSSKDILPLHGINPLFLDRYGNGFIAADFETRQQYLGERICMLMSLWELSTQTRAKRFKSLLKLVHVDTDTR